MPEDAQAASTATPRLWTRDFILLMMSTFALFASFYFLMPVLPIYVSERLGGDQATIGFIAGLFTATAVVFRPIGGFLMDRFGRRGVHLIALAAFAMAIGSYALAGTLGVLIAVRLLHGLPWGAANTAANTVAADLVPRQRRGEGIGLFGLGQTLAMAVAPATAIIIVGEDRFVLLFLSAAALATVALFLAMLIRHPRVANPGVRLRLNTLFDARVAWVAVAVSFVMAGYSSVSSFVVVYARDLGISNPGLFFTLQAAGLVASRLTAGRLLDRHGPGRVVGAGLILLAICFGLLSLGSPGYFASAVFLGLGFGAVVPSFLAMAPSMVPADRRGAAYATVLGALDAGFGLGAYLLGRVALALDYGPMYLVAGALLAIPAVVLVTRIVPDHRRLQALQVATGVGSSAQQ